MPPSDPEAERRSYLEEAERLRAFAAATKDAPRRRLLLMLAESYEELARGTLHRAEKRE